jgi:hypothetical protein
MDRAEFEAALRPREEFVAALSSACVNGTPFATGKLGDSERAFLRVPVVRASERDRLRLRAFEVTVAFRMLRIAGVFPADPAFQERWAAVYADQVRQLDWIGVDPAAHREHLGTAGFHGLEDHPLLRYKEQEPDRSSPHDESRCWLPSLRDRDVLLVCSFAELLRSRANRETFEAVWVKTGKPWFHPRSVQALEFPNGFFPSTRERYPTSLDLLDDVVGEIAAREFDVALIAAGGLGVPLAAAVKRMGKVGVSMGSHIQVLFGVLAERYSLRKGWDERYFNEAWAEIPEHYRPALAYRDTNSW